MSSKKSTRSAFAAAAAALSPAPARPPASAGKSAAPRAAKSHASSAAAPPAPAASKASASDAASSGASSSVDASRSSSQSPAASAEWNLGSVLPTAVLDAMSPADWRRETSKPFVDTLLALDPPHALGVLVAYAGHPAMNLANRLADCARNDLKRLADFLRVVSPSGAASIEALTGAISTSVFEHQKKYQHLDHVLALEQKGKRDAPEQKQPEMKQRDADDDDHHRHASSRRADPFPAIAPHHAASRPRHSRTPSPRSRSPLSRPSTPRKAKEDAAKNAELARLKEALRLAAVGRGGASPSAASSRALFQDEKSSSKDAKELGLSSSVLKALGSLPDPPSRQQLHRDDASASKHPSGRDARKAHHSSRYDPDEEDSDSDGPSASTSRRKQHQPSLFLDDRPARRAPRRRSPSAGASSSGFPSDDSDPSSEESDDGASDGGAAYYSSRRSARRALEDDMEESGLSKPLARKFLRNLQRAAGSRSFSVLGLYKDRDVRNTRNRHEMEFLARVIDLMRKGRSAHVMEALVRRLVGVETADRSGNWKLCDAFELITEKQSFVPDDFLARALKTVKRIEAVEGKDRQRDRHRDAASSNTRGNAYGRSSSGYGSNARGRDRYPSEPSAYNGRERSSSRGPAASSSSSAQQQPHSKQQQQGGKQQQRGPRKGE